jgi:hypothetical protein
MTRKVWQTVSSVNALQWEKYTQLLLIKRLWQSWSFGKPSFHQNQACCSLLKNTYQCKQNDKHIPGIDSALKTLTGTNCIHLYCWKLTSHTHTYTPIHTHTHPYTPIHTHTHTYTPIHTHTHTYTPIHTHTYTHIHTHTHTLTNFITLTDFYAFSYVLK